MSWSGRCYYLSTARMADDAPWRPAGAPDAVDSAAAQLHRSSMDTSPSATERSKRVITPEDGSRLKRVDSKRTPQKQRQRRAEMQLVTPQGEDDDFVARRLWVQHDLAPLLPAAVARLEAKRKAKLREKEEAEYVAQCAMLGLAVVAAPPLPDGATDADRERLEDAALEALYGD